MNYKKIIYNLFIYLILILIILIILFLVPKRLNYRKQRIKSNISKKEFNYLNSKILVNPFKRLNKNPYHIKNLKNFNYKQKGICGYKLLNNNKYMLKSYKNFIDLNSDNAIFTHYGNCGLCSTLHDLAIYKKKPNLTKIIKKCNLANFFSNERIKKCMENKLNLTKPCLDIWWYDNENTRKKCMIPCLWNFTSSFVNKNNKLNKCLLCDERMNGSIFKKIAGRNRRNSLIKSAITRHKNN